MHHYVSTSPLSRFVKRIRVTISVAIIRRMLLMVGANGVHYSKFRHLSYHSDTMKLIFNFMVQNVTYHEYNSIGLKPYNPVYRTTYRIIICIMFELCVHDVDLWYTYDI